MRRLTWLQIRRLRGELQRRSYHRPILVGVACLFLYLCHRAPAVNLAEMDEDSIEALFACQDAIIQRYRWPVVRVADWEREMAVNVGGTSYRVQSHVEAGSDSLQLRLFRIECTAVRVESGNWRNTESVALVVSTPS